MYLRRLEDIEVIEVILRRLVWTVINIYMKSTLIDSLIEFVNSAVNLYYLSF